MLNMVHLALALDVSLGLPSYFLKLTPLRLPPFRVFPHDCENGVQLQQDGIRISRNLKYRKLPVSVFVNSWVKLGGSIETIFFHMTNFPKTRHF